MLLYAEYANCMGEFYRGMAEVHIPDVERAAFMSYMKQKTRMLHNKPVKPQRYRKNTDALALQCLSPQPTAEASVRDSYYFPERYKAAFVELPFSALQVLADSSAIEDECIDLQSSSKLARFHIERLQRKLQAKRDEIEHLQHYNRQMAQALRSAATQLRVLKQDGKYPSGYSLNAQAEEAESSALKQESGDATPHNPRFDLLENAEIRKLQRRNSELTMRLEKLESSAAVSMASVQSPAENDARQLQYLRQSKIKLKNDNDKLLAENARLKQRICTLEANLAKSKANEEELNRVVIEMSRAVQE